MNPPDPRAPKNAVAAHGAPQPSGTGAFNPWTWQGRMGRLQLAALNTVLVVVAVLVVVVSVLASQPSVFLAREVVAESVWAVGPLVKDLGRTASLLVLLVTGIGAVVFSTFWTIQRAHDIGWSGWAVLLVGVPIVGWVVWLGFFLMAGKPMANAWGAPPAPPTALVKFAGIVFLLPALGGVLLILLRLGTALAS